MKRNPPFLYLGERIECLLEKYPLEQPKTFHSGLLVHYHSQLAKESLHLRHQLGPAHNSK